MNPGDSRVCVYVELRGDRGYFGMLSVDPSRQGRGVGRRLIDRGRYARANGCTAMDIRVVNLRTSLPPFYR
jgi:ribosomal protein S18 acetylase RimI-like enzyme